MEQAQQEKIMNIQVMIKRIFGTKLSRWSYSMKNERLEGILYGALLLSCEFDRYDTLGFALRVGDLPVTSFFGYRGLVKADPEAISEVHQHIDEYCRALLPDKFLERFDDSLT